MEDNTTDTKDPMTGVETAQDENNLPMIGPAPASESTKSADMSGSFTFKVSNFRDIKETRMNSPTFTIGQTNWSILLFPRGNGEHTGKYVSVYLQVADIKTQAAGYGREANFSLELVNHIDATKSILKDAKHYFYSHEPDWGFGQLVALTKVLDKEAGFLLDNTITINVNVQVSKDSTYNWATYDSKKETGHVGLKNQGATCYMNSLLQTLFHTPKFRRAVYQIPTHGDIEKNTIPVALQRVFFRLEVSDDSVPTKELTKSFGWEGSDSFTQHDVQELNRVLSDNLEQKMKGTPVDGTIANLFEGKTQNYIKCVNVDYESKREESFYDLSLNVKGCKDIYESFEKYVEEEMLEGDNKYHAEGHGLQDAKKGVRFTKLPPVLHLQLKRFEYDPYRDAMVKVHDKFAFYQDLDLNKFVDSAEENVSNIYSLHGVLVHAGDVHGGHYYAFLRPNQEQKWFKFDDDRVTFVEEAVAIEDNFGGEQDYSYQDYTGRKVTTMRKKYASAYMLVYFRKQDYPDILCDATVNEIDARVRDHFHQEAHREELRRKEKLEAHLYTTIRIATSKDLLGYSSPELVEFTKLKEIKVKKDATVPELKAVIEQESQIPVHKQRLWKWHGRENKTFRVGALITPDMEEKTVEQVFYLIYEKALYVEEIEEGNDEDPIGKSLIFFKKYDREKKSISVVGHRLFSTNQLCEDLAKAARELDNIPEDHTIVVLEEATPYNISLLEPTLTLKQSALQTGDIIVFYDSPEQNSSADQDPVVKFYDYLENRVQVHFRELANPKDDKFTLELSKKDHHDVVAEALAAKLNADPLYIRFTGHLGWRDEPRTMPIKRTERLTLDEMIASYSYSSTPTPNVLFYEVLEMPLSKIEVMKKIKIYWSNEKLEETEYTFFLPKEYTFGQVADHIREELKVEASSKIRFLDVWSSKIVKEFEPKDTIFYISDYTHVRAEVVPQEELEVGSDQKVITVHHFQKGTSHYVSFHGTPFNLVISKDEKISEIKARVQKRLSLTDEQVAKWKAGVANYSRAEFLEDDAVLYEVKFDPKSEFFGFEHPAPKTTYSRVAEKSIRIYN
eukprot:TRINITY_DN1515_c0_g1_i1.p1 TRINITY_DN1515_c0_g1~~TRINITY_DN1515_c0_g1_i1.p1  ORF type:complete len:1071 (-),score=238.11 TRINITY_DN1515_c0_g1_i1:366-3578(-)